MRKKVDLMPDPTTRIGIGNNQEILKIPIVMDIQAPAGSKTSAPATNHPPKCHLDASAGATSVRCTSGPYPMCDVAGSLVSRELVSGVATLLGDCPAIGVTRGTLATGIGKTYSPLGSYFADVTHSENTTQNAAYATIEFSHLSLTPSKKVTGRRKRAVGSPQRDAKAMKLEDRKPRALVNSESSSQPTRQSLRLSSALQDEYDDMQLPLKKRRRCSLYHPKDSSTSLWQSSKRILLETIVEEEEVVLPSQPERSSASNQHHII